MKTTIKAHSNQHSWDETLQLNRFRHWFCFSVHIELPMETARKSHSFVPAMSTTIRDRNVMNRNHQSTTGCFQNSWYTDLVWLLRCRNFIKLRNSRWIFYGKFCVCMCLCVCMCVWGDQCWKCEGKHGPTYKDKLNSLWYNHVTYSAPKTVPGTQ